MPLRSKDEISKAHDTFTHILLTDELRNKLSHDQLLAMCSSCDVLCWILRHDNNDSFANNLKESIEWLKANGYESVRVQ